MSAELDAMKAQVARVTTLSGSIVALVNGLAAQIEANKTDPAAMQALADELRGDADSLQQAVQANTPAQGGTAGQPGATGAPAAQAPAAHPHPHPHPGPHPHPPGRP